MMKIDPPGACTFALLLAAPAFGQSTLQTFDGSGLIGLGDLNDDGFGEVALADAFASNGTTVGTVQVVSPQTGAVLASLVDPLAPTHFGQRVASAGDLTGDGKCDVLVSDDRDTALYRVWAFDGVSGDVIHRWTRPKFNGSGFGYAMAGIGDGDGDGTNDVAIGENDTRGRVTLFSGATGAQIWNVQGSIQTQQGFTGNLGFALAAAGDFNGDGFADVLAGQPGSDDPFGIGDGFLVLDGRSGATLTSYDAASGGSLDFGTSVGTVGDLDEDGTPDYMVGPGFAGPGAETQIVSGATGAILRALSPQPGQGATFGAALRYVGNPSVVLGDVTGDGTPDIGVGWQTFGARTGFTIFDGSTGSQLFDLVRPDGSVSLRGLAPLGDIDGDGFADLGVQRTQEPSSFVYFISVLDGEGMDAVARTPVNGRSICLGLPNSTGAPANLRSFSPSGYSAAADDLTLVATNLPSSTFGLFVVSQGQGINFNPGGNEGRLCIAGPAIGRLAVVEADPVGNVAFSPGLTSLPLGAINVPAAAGERFNFQLWYRDTNAQGATSNFSAAVGITFQ